MQTSDILVTVICKTYNHESYIGRCLDGFVNQKTNFKFEVIVHDDASTDNTPNIIKKYEKQYPDIIKPIYQSENQWSKGVKALGEFVFPKISSKYVAICEGDDYWIDENKLQKQFDYMETHSSCGIFVHETWRNNLYTNTKELVTNEPCERDYSVEDVIGFRSGHFSTCSIFMKTELRKSVPKEFRCSSFGDYQIIVYGASHNYCHYSPEVMAVYNYGTSGSYTSKRLKNIDYYIKTRYEIIDLLKRFDKYYNYSYSKTIQSLIRKTKWEIVQIRTKHIIKTCFPFLKRFVKGKKR